jgi:kynureninase
MAPEFSPDESFALSLDAADPLARFRDQFHFPTSDNPADPLIYFCGNSLGLQPKTTRSSLLAELDAWAHLGVEGHFKPENPWVEFDAPIAALMAEVVGARPAEVAVMNGLTVNLHVLMASFYRPTPQRHKILMEARAFPSDQYAAQSQASFHGYAPESSILELAPRDGEDELRLDDILATIAERGDEIAVVLLGGINYLTGQAFDIEAVVRAAHAKGCLVCIDAAHAAGNVPLKLHDWGVDFAVWCTYKYLNAGPGAVAACFVHERHADRPDLPRFAGWWGNRPETRFRMSETIDTQPGAQGWRLSNPPILALSPLKDALEIFHAAGMARLRGKSEMLSGYLMFLLDMQGDDRFSVLTPRRCEERGCQVSIRVERDGRAVFNALRARGVIGDFREPNVIRMSPVPLYNSFHEVWRFAQKWRAVFNA